MSDPIVKRGGTRSVIGTEVSEMEVILLGDANTTVQSLSLGKFAVEGGFDGATVSVQRHFAPDWDSTSVGSLNMFLGRVGEVSIVGAEVTLNVKSMLELLNVQMPRNLYSASCSRTLYDEGCGLVAANFTVTANVTANSTRLTVNTNLSQSTGYFSLGTVEGITGLNAGIKRTVKLHSNANGVLRVAFPFPYIPSPGDHFAVKPGCDKLMATCNAKFSNLDNFRGFPFIPVPEATT